MKYIIAFLFSCSFVFAGLIMQTPPPVNSTPAPTPVPLQIAGCQLWYDIQDNTKVTVVSGKVAAIVDKSGNLNNAAQVTSTNQFTYAATGINGFASLESTTAGASTIHMALTSNIGSLPTSIVSVVYIPTPSGDSFNTVFSNGGSGVLLWPSITFPSGSQNHAEVYDGTGDIYTTKSTGVISTPYMLTTVIQTNSVTFYYDTTTNSSSGSGPFSAANLTNVTTLGGGNFPSFYGFLGEVIVYNVALTSGNVSTLYAYENTKWGGL